MVNQSSCRRQAPTPYATRTAGNGCCCTNPGMQSRSRMTMPQNSPSGCHGNDQKGASSKGCTMQHTHHQEKTCNTQVQNRRQEMSCSAPVQNRRQEMSCNAPVQGCRQENSCSASVQGCRQEMSCSASVQNRRQEMSCSTPVQGCRQEMSCNAPVQGCRQETTAASTVNLPTGRRELLNYIDQVSFGAYEALLYLDTHPDCQEGMAYFHENNRKRNHALREYARLYGPLNLAHVKEEGCSSWEWVNQPWPWEGGNC